MNKNLNKMVTIIQLGICIWDDDWIVLVLVHGCWPVPPAQSKYFVNVTGNFVVMCQNHADVKKSGWPYVRLSGQICQIIKWELWTRENSNFWVSHGLNGSLLSEFAFAYMLWILQVLQDVPERTIHHQIWIELLKQNGWGEKEPFSVLESSVLLQALLAWQ